MTRRAGATPITRPDGPPDWYRDAVIYELHVRAFADSNGDGVGDFNGLTARLDYLADLGVTAVWLLPFYPSPGRDDGYDIAEYETVNPLYGELRSFRRFLAAAHERGIRVITELVVNHTSDQHAWFQRSRRAPAGSPERDFYVWSDDPQRYADARVIFQDFETSNWTWDPEAGAYFWHRFYSHQPDLNYENPAVERAVTGVLDHWLGMGVDGLRLDAVPYLYEAEGTNCENLPATHGALRRLRAHVDAHHPGTMLLAEANQWPEDAAAYFGDDDECHMNFHFPVMPRLFMALSMEQRAPIVDIMEQTPRPPGSCQWAMFLRNHDELTLEMVTDEERDLMLRAYASDARMRINLGIRRRLAPLLGNDRRRIELLNGLLFSLPGTPVIYYGDEIGMGDNVYLGDRNGVRTPMQWSADRNAGFSTANPHQLYLPLVTEQGYHYESVNVETQQGNPASLLSWMRQLIALRKRHPVFGRGSLTFLEPDNHRVLAFVRELDGEAPLLCVANLSRLAQHVELDLRAFAGQVPVELFGRSRFGAVTERAYPLTLAPYGFFWFALEDADESVAVASGDVPSLPGTWVEVLRRRAPLARAIARWLPTRRWYGAKAATVREVTVVDVVEFAPDVAFAVVRVDFTEGEDHAYAVPLRRHVGALPDGAAGAVIAQLDGGVLVDAMAIPEGAAAVVAAAVRRRAIEGRSRRLEGRPRRTGVSRVAREPGAVTPLQVEQSNSSVLVDGRYVAKLTRRLVPGVNPDVELPVHLRRRGVAHVPAVVATLELFGCEGTEATTALLVHEAVAHESDLWTWTQDTLARDLEATVADVDEPGGAAVHHVLDLLARRTAEMHQGLAGGAAGFEPQPFSLLWQRSILQSLRGALRETQRTLRRRLAAIPDDARPVAETVLDRGDELLARFDELRTRKLDAHRIRVHGDYHLGQVLWTGRDLYIIDFEGEPGQSMGARAIKRSPLVDVAGMVRSIDYAGRVAVATAEARGRTPAAERPRLDAWRARWTADARDVFLNRYVEAMTGPDSPAPDLLPADDVDRRLILDAYVVLKALYEVRYDLANRPDWVTWPLEGVASLLG